MNRFLKTAILSAAVAATTLVSLPAAEAGERWRHRGRDDGNLVAAGILGLAAGALVVGLAAREPVYREPVDANPYRRPRPRPDRDYVEYDRGPQVVYADDYYSVMEPWTAEWYQYCSDRYRSFNPRTGTFNDYDGLTHFCVAD